MTHLTLRLSGTPSAQSAVLAALAAEPCVQLPVVWVLSTREDGSCVIREPGRRSAVGSSWEGAVRGMLAAPVPLKDITVRGPGRWK